MDNSLKNGKNHTIIEKILNYYANIPVVNGKMKSQVVFDRINNHYLLMNIGRDHNDKRAHGCIVHVDIIENKFWIHYDGIEYGIAKELEDVGIPKNKIVLAFHSRYLRECGDYTVE